MRTLSWIIWVALNAIGSVLVREWQREIKHTYRGGDVKKAAEIEGSDQKPRNADSFQKLEV